MAPRLGAFIVNNSLPCSVWPVPPVAPPGAAHRGRTPADPGRRHHPATRRPHWCRHGRSAGALDGGRLLGCRRRAAHRHSTTATSASTDAVTRYLVDRELPSPQYHVLRCCAVTPCASPRSARPASAGPSAASKSSNVVRGVLRCPELDQVVDHEAVPPEAADPLAVGQLEVDGALAARRRRSGACRSRQRRSRRVHALALEVPGEVGPRRGVGEHQTDRRVAAGGPPRAPNAPGSQNDIAPWSQNTRSNDASASGTASPLAHTSVSPSGAESTSSACA